MFAIRCNEYTTPHDYWTIDQARQTLADMRASRQGGSQLICQHDDHEVIDSAGSVVAHEYRLFSSTITSIPVHVEPDSTEGKTRYSFSLPGTDGATREFIVDVPDSETQYDDTTDVWVLNSTIQVGDTPADGFATYTPVSGGE